MKKKLRGLARRPLDSLGDAAGGALVDACTAVDALGSIDDSDVLDGQGALGANVGAGAAGYTLGSVDLDCHLNDL